LLLPNGGKLTLEPIVRKGNRLGMADGFDPCVVLLNNDLSAGVPDILKGLEQNVMPPLEAGWTTRRKSKHFAAYDNVADDFGTLLNIDPWLINPYFAVCSEVDFHARTGEDCLASQVDFVLQRIRAKYAEYGVKDDPFVIVKADAGTYGMGIMTVKDASEVRDLNRKQRNKMAVVKEGLQVSDVLVQEGVYTFEQINESVAEPVIYMIDHFVVGGFYRVNTSRGVDENLNAPGMSFSPLAFESCCAFPNPDCAPDDTPNRFYAYGVVGRLAMLAAAKEVEELIA
jgi:glutamate--cysteine ligase